jgi:light-harvesting complex 1 alpha chain
MFNSLFSDIYKVWLIFDPRRALIAMFAFLTVLALVIHMLLLSTDRYNWVEGARVAAGAAVQQVAPAAQGQAQ